ncbi:MAG TPA: response regulator transcription factor [Blastococcus sp.]|nr:response regulator transcription factor [Blastococcus sp.]
MITVLVVDDHPLFRAGVQTLLDSVPDVELVAVAADGEGAVREATLNRPDVVLMDLTMPGMGGLEATRRIVHACPGSAVLVLSMLDDDESVLAAMRAGARGYVPKGAGQEELLTAIRAVATGGAVFGAGVAARILAGLDRSPAPAFPGLTERESEVLSLMAEGLDNRRIAERLQVSAKTVANHVSHVLTKLQARDRVEAVLRAREGGR